MVFTNELSPADISRMINNTPIFSSIGIHEQHLIASKCVLITRDANEIVIEQGDLGDQLYIIVKGRVLITKKAGTDNWVRINTLGPGDVFGEIAILRNVPRTARVTTLSPCTFLTIDAANFLSIYQYFSPKSRDNIQLVITKRLQQQKNAGFYHADQ